jgi:hypothetical protein
MSADASSDLARSTNWGGRPLSRCRAVCERLRLPNSLYAGVSEVARKIVTVAQQRDDNLRYLLTRELDV